MMSAYATIYAFALVAVAFGAVSLIGAWLLRPQAYDAIKATTYECGMPAIGTTEIKTNIRFYVYALIFVIFEVETLYIYPWAVAADGLGPVGLIEMLVFIAVLFLGLVYAWRKGALTWE